MTSDGIDLDIYGARVYAIPMTTRFRGITIREGMLIEGPAGWGEFCPFRDYDDREAASWRGDPAARQGRWRVGIRGTALPHH